MSKEAIILKEINSACERLIEKREIDMFGHNIAIHEDLSNIEIVHIVLHKSGNKYLVDINVTDFISWLEKNMIGSILEATIFSTINTDYFIRFQSEEISGYLFESDTELISRITYDLLDTRRIDPVFRLIGTPNLQYGFRINGMKDNVPIHIVIPWAKITQLRATSPNIENSIKEDIMAEIILQRKSYEKDI